MYWKTAIRLLILASCLSSPGCVMAPGHSAGGTNDKKHDGTKGGDADHSELQRELGLYSD